MPVLNVTSLLLTSIANSSVTTNGSNSNNNNNNYNTNNTASNATIASNTTTDVLQVVCAFPVSGQYGPGSRILYYVLIAACVFARKAEWLRNACLAAALLFPAVAAIHGIVLAVINVPGAVDMDVYGAFQLCSIGILAAPVTVKLSRTYFYDPGRNTIFAWTALILAGLLSLTVEFFRINTSPCPYDDAGNPVSPRASQFGYNITCGLTCDVNLGPFSPLRKGSANNIYVIPAPDKLTFDTATLLSAACAVPAILSLVSMWNKILEINWKARRNREQKEKEKIDDPIKGTNGATAKKMKGVNSVIRLFLSAVEIPVFGAAVLAILINGERNFWSPQVYYQTEPIASVGQWAPIVGTGLAVIGSLYILLAADLDAVEKDVDSNASQHGRSGSVEGIGLGLNGIFSGSHHSIVHQDDANGGTSVSKDKEGTSDNIEATVSHQSRPAPSIHQVKRSWTIDSGAGKRREVAKALISIGNYLGNAASDRFDDNAFRESEAQDFPEIPGEPQRNSALRQIKKQYNQYRNADGDVTPVLHRQPSRVGSYAGSIASREGSPPPPSPRRPQDARMSDDRITFDIVDSPLSSGPGRPRTRRDTLEVPSQVHHSPKWVDPPSESGPAVIIPSEGQNSPLIVISPDFNEHALNHIPVFTEPEQYSPAEPGLSQAEAKPLAEFSSR